MKSYLEVNGQKLESLENELWKSIGNTYYVSSKGRIATTNHRGSGKLSLMKPANNGQGYYTTVLVLNGKNKSVKIHRLVAQAFIPNPLKLATVNHKDFDKSNNCVENLEWMSAKENSLHAFNAGRFYLWQKGQKQHPNCIKIGENNGISILTEKDVLEIRAKFKPRKYTREMLAVEYGVKACTIKDVILRRSWAHVK